MLKQLKLSVWLLLLLSFVTVRVNASVHWGEIKGFTSNDFFYSSAFSGHFPIYHNLLTFLDEDYIAENENRLEFYCNKQFNGLTISYVDANGELANSHIYESFTEGYTNTRFVDVLRTFSTYVLLSSNIYAVRFYNGEEVVGLCFFNFNGIRVGDLTYTYNAQTNQASVLGLAHDPNSSGHEYGEEVAIPETVELHGKVYDVTRIISLSERGLETYGCKKLTIPASITTIDVNAFADHRDLEEVVFLDGAEEIDMGLIKEGTTLLPAFRRNGIKKLYLGRPHVQYSNISFSPFYAKTTLKEVVVGPMVKELKRDAFENCSSLAKVELKEGVTSIGHEAFSGCSALSDISLPLSLESIETYAFSNCTSLQKIVLPDKLENIGGGAFFLCGLQSIVIPPSVTTIGKSTSSTGTIRWINCFASCGMLTDIIVLCPANVQTFPELRTMENVFVPDAKTYGWGKNILTLSATEFNYTGRNILCEFVHGFSEQAKIANDISWNSTLGTEVGNYDKVDIELLYNDSSYTYTMASTYKILPVPLIIKTENYSRVYGEENPEFKILYSGFVNEENEASALTMMPTVSVNANSDSDAGEYPINISGAGARNYAITYQPGILTINKASQTIEWLQELNEVRVGEKVELTAISSINAPVTYISSDEKIAIIDGATATFISKGKVTITAQQMGDKNHLASNIIEKEIAVSPILVESITLNQTTRECVENESFQLTATITPNNATNNEIVWTSSNSEVATVDNQGLVTAVSVGFADIMATAADGSGVKAVCKVEVLPTLAESIVIKAEGTTTLKDGETIQLAAEIHPETTTDKSIIWTSSDSEVATVDENGLVTACSKTGRVIITATCGEVSGTIEITVAPTPVENIVIQLSELILQTGETAQLYATVLPENATDKSITWVSSNPEVATVSEEGIVTAVSVGETMITAVSTQIPLVSGTCTVKVELPSGISSTEVEGFKLRVSGQYLIIEGTEAEVQIITLDGRHIYLGNDRKIALSSGIYIVKLGKVVKKITI